MTEAFNKRIVRVEIDFPDSTKVYKELYIRASGMRAISSVTGNCSITIINMLKKDRDFLITQSSLQNYNRSPLLVRLYVGRNYFNTGDEEFLLYTGYMFASYASPPPDIGITLQSIENGIASFIVGNGNYPAISSISNIAQSIATNSKLQLDYQAKKDKQVANFNTGNVGVDKQIKKLNELGVNAFVDNGVLVVLDIGASRGTELKEISLANGMIDIPQITIDGVVAKVLLSNEIQLGNRVKLTSIQNPAANGEYIVIRMNYEVANRDVPFYYEFLLANPNNILKTSFL